MGIRASQVVAHIDKTSSFGAKIRIKKAGGNGERATVSCLKQLCFSEEKKMRFSRGEVVFYSLKIRSKTANVAEVNEEEVEGMKTFEVANKSSATWGHFWSPPQKWSCETQGETFNKITTSFNGKFTESPEIIQIRTVKLFIESFSVKLFIGSFLVKLFTESFPVKLSIQSLPVSKLFTESLLVSVYLSGPTQFPLPGKHNLQTIMKT
ncbi:hypothetical protein E2C01_052319 [Portunus trituberculatus]|uniref:Uncharacterized protein n=1 Tax=Portunus trituberculatus TaxID=210409 RepID=A0A5B7GE94_PORTR|nr:hypothetical protein [Portunus trituberculatus]